MEKRVLITVLLSIAVMYGYSFLVTTPPVKKEVRKETPVQQEMSAVRVSPAPSVPRAVTASVSSPGVRDVVVDTELYSAVFSTNGAALKKFILKKYKTTTKPDALQIALIDESAPDRYSLQTIGKGLPIDRGAVYSTVSRNLQVGRGEKKTLEFVATTASGDYVRKIFTFPGGATPLAWNSSWETRAARGMTGFSSWW
jgi:YidC/Oxa1 family membrane protein insertase